MKKFVLAMSLALGIGVILGVFISGNLSAQSSNTSIRRVVLLRSDLAQTDAATEVVLGTAEIPAGTAAGRHTHAGMEIGYVLNGEALLEVEGETPRALRAGDAFAIPAGKIHDAKVTGGSAAKVLAFYVVAKGKPLASPASP